MLCLIVLALAGCNPDAQNSGGVLLATPPPFEETLQIYLHPSKAFSVRLPDDWAIADLSTGNNLLVEFSPPGAARPPLVVRVRNTGAPLDIESFERLIGEYQTTYYGGAAIYSPQERIVQADGSWLVPALRQTGDTTLRLNTFYQRNGAFFSVIEVLLPPDNPDLIKTLDLIVDTYAVDPEAVLRPGTLPTPATAPSIHSGQTATGVVGFRGMYEWTDSQGTFHINGQVVNNDTKPLEFVRIAAYLFDAEGNVVAEQTDFATADVIEPTDASSFRVIFAQGKPITAVRYELHASARHADASTFYGPANFILEDRADFNEQGHLVISGTITNTGESMAHYVKVTVTVFDGQGRVVATDSLFVQNKDFAPGDSAGYQLTFFELGGEAVRFTSTVQASLNWP